MLVHVPPARVGATAGGADHPGDWPDGQSRTSRQATSWSCDTSGLRTARQDIQAWSGLTGCGSSSIAATRLGRSADDAVASGSTCPTRHGPAESPSRQAPAERQCADRPPTAADHPAGRRIPLPPGTASPGARSPDGMFEGEWRRDDDAARTLAIEPFETFPAAELPALMRKDPPCGLAAAGWRQVARAPTS